MCFIENESRIQADTSEQTNDSKSGTGSLQTKLNAGLSEKQQDLSKSERSSPPSTLLDKLTRPLPTRIYPASVTFD